jgi:RimJ/RimL family protein N-acetyltransferase
MENLHVHIKLLHAKDSDHRFLYNLLKIRNPIANISHRGMPSYKEHVNFVESKPYSKWYVIYYRNQKAGSVYLSKNDEIGIFLKNEFQKEGIGEKVLEMIKLKNPRKRYLANINPKNKKSIKFFKKNNFKLIQYTYELNSD